MVDISNPDWSTTDGSNTQAPPNGWPSGMAPNSVRPTAQQMMGAIKRWWERIGPVLNAGGSSGAYTYTPTNTAYPTVYIQGDVYSFTAQFTSIGNDTLSVNGLSALNLYKPSSSGPIKIIAGDISSGQPVICSFDASLNSGAGGFNILAGITPPNAGAQAIQFAPAYNASMSVLSASATATFNADFITVATSLGFFIATYPLAGFSRTVNLGLSGAGGMDVGSAPTNGFVSLYGILNPTALSYAILACNASTSSGSIYSGVNLPSGYIASGLLGIWPTNGSGQFVRGFQRNRSVWFGGVSVSLGTPASYTALSIAAAVPQAAISFSGVMQNTLNSAMSIDLSANSSGTGQQSFTYTNGVGVMAIPITQFPILTSQTVYYRSGGIAAGFSITGYMF